MLVQCPDCQERVDPAKAFCPCCGCEVAVLGQIIAASFESIQLSLESLKEGRAQDALDFAYEAWGLKNSREASAAGLIAATANEDTVEMKRWLNRRPLA